VELLKEIGFGKGLLKSKTPEFERWDLNPLHYILTLLGYPGFICQLHRQNLNSDRKLTVYPE
jgi:hypothetical protein